MLKRAFLLFGRVLESFNRALGEMEISKILLQTLNLQFLRIFCDPMFV